jgi:hypothetical protein
VGYGDVHGQLPICYVTSEAQLKVQLVQTFMGKQWLLIMNQALQRKCMYDELCFTQFPQ